MTTKIQKWGNSLAVRIPKEMVRSLALKEGGNVLMREDKDTLVIRKQDLRDSPTRKGDWKKYIIPVRHKKENVSGSIDKILYGVSR
jgi:antitoxin component of MazEF toxin-antitoxin module